MMPTAWRGERARLLAAGFLIVSMAYFVMGVRDTLAHERLRTTGRIAQGRVAGVERVSALTGRQYVATYVFDTAEGAAVSGRQLVSPTFFANARTGQMRPVRYLPDDPSQNEIEGDYLANRAMMAAFVGLGGVLLSAVAAFRQAGATERN